MSDYPKDWEEVELGEYNLITSSKRVFEKEWENRGVPFFRTRDIVSFHSKEEQNDKLFISEETYRNKVMVSGAPHKGDLLVTGVGSIGIPFLIENDNKIYFKDGNIIWIKKGDFFHPKYLYYLFLSSKIKNQILNLSGFTTVGTFTIQNAKKLKIPIPPLEEQKVIADTLMTFDKHIENLENLIEKKKMIRDGAVEDLMTGKTRLDGFDDEWEEVGFSDVVIPKARIGWQGLKKEEYLQSGYSYLISGTDFNNGTISFDGISFVTKERFDLDVNIQVCSGDVLVTKDGTIGKVAIVPNINKKATLNSGVFVFKTNKKLKKYFLYWILRSSMFEKFISELSAGSTIKHLYQKDLKRFSLYIPTGIKEQQAIADILTSMDDEIENLEKEKAKIEKIKAGAMDDLLTGRVRLI